MVPINVRITQVDRTNNKVYTSNFPSVYASDSWNRGTPSELGGSLSRSNSNRGASEYFYYNIGWPYSSNFNDISEKVVMKIRGGITCCNSYHSFYMDDNVTSAYTELWTDTVANITVYRTPSRSSGQSTSIQIINVVNPYPIDKETYEQLKELEIFFYDNYQHKYIKQFEQFSYASYSQLSEISVSTNFGSPVDSTRSYSYHSDYPMTYDIAYTFSRSSFPNRELDYTILKFTGGIRKIEEAYIRYGSSPYLVNTVIDVKIFKDGSNYWCLKIAGMDDSLYASSWYIRMRFYPNANTLSYTSTTYAKNGEIEFTNSNS